jgi:uncharacterized protein (TIGR03437 family)
MRRVLLSGLLLLEFTVPALCQVKRIAVKHVAKDKNEEDNPRARDEWFYRQRAYPNKGIPPGARFNAVQEMERIDRAARPLRAASANLSASSSGTWTFLGPDPTHCSPYVCQSDIATSGRVTALAIDPRNANTVYAGGAYGGVWKTTNGGTSWTPLTDAQASLGTGAIALDPKNPDTVYVGTGEANNAADSYYGAGILKSTNGGSTWTNITGPFVSFPSVQMQIGALAVSPGNSQDVLAGTNNPGLELDGYLGGDDGIFQSLDGGATWKQVLSGGAGSAIVFDPVNPTTVYAAIGDFAGADANGVYKSADGGTTWTKMNGSGANAFPVSGSGRIALAIAASTPSTIYALVQDNSGIFLASGYVGVLGVWKTTDGASTWNRVITDLPTDPSSGEPFCGGNGQCFYDLTIEVDPKNANIVVVGGVTLARSVNGGATFTAIPLEAASGSPVHVDQHALAFSADLTKFYVGNDGGVWSAAAADIANGNLQTINLTNLNSTLGLTQFGQGLSTFPGVANSALGGTQDNGTQLLGSQLLGSNEWTNISGGDGGYTAVDPALPSILYGNYTSISVWKSISIDQGSGAQYPIPWSAAFGIDQNDQSAFYAPLAIDSLNPQYLYFGTQRVYQSQDGAGFWAPVSGDLTGGSSFDTTSAIASSPADSNNVYAGTSNGRIYSTANALSSSPSWTNRTQGLPNLYLSTIAPDPLDPLTAYIGFSGFSTTTNPGGHIYKTSNGGSSWTNISGNLPNIPVNSLVVDPDLPATIYAGTDAGVQVTSDGGASWASLGSGLPRSVALSIALERKTRVLYAGTHGRGIWSVSLPLSGGTLQPSISSLSPSEKDANSAAFALTVNGANFSSGTVVLWNGTARPTTVNSSNQLTAQITAADVKAQGRATVTAFTAASGGGASGPATFNIGSSPAPNQGGITNAADGNVKTLAPGMISAFYGVNMAGKVATAYAAPPLPITLGGTTLVEDGEPLPLFFVSPNQIDFQVSWFQEPGTPSLFTVVVGAQQSKTLTFQIASVAPALFSTNSQGSGQGSILVANTSILAAPAGVTSSSRPAKRGEAIEIFATGLGAVDQLIFDGDSAPGNPAANTLATATVTIGNVPAKVLFSGLAPGFVGLNQVNVTVPQSVTPGSSVPVVLTIGGVTSNTVTMAVQ